MSALQARARGLAGDAARDVLVLWRRHDGGELSRAAFTRAAASALALTNRRAVQLADLAVMAALIRQLRRTIPPLGLVPDPVELDLARLSGVVADVLDAEIASATTVQEIATSTSSRLTVAARAEPLTTTQNAMTRAMTQRDVPGWTREVSARGCPLCRSLAGEVLPPSAPMVRHAGCSCVQQPVFS